MNHLFSWITGKGKQYVIALLSVFLVSGACYLFSSYLDYRVVALLLLLVVSVIAVSFDIFPVLLAAFFSALIWNYFFIPPIHNFHVASSGDLVLLIMYFLIAMINAVLTYKIRKAEKKAREKEEKANAVKLYNTMLNSLSHELRTPIAAIIGATDNLQSSNNNLTPVHKDQLIAEISKAALRLDRQVGNLLDISRLESGFIEAKQTWVDMVETIHDIVYKIEENGVSQKIHIDISPAIPLFKTDKVMIEQIVSNIINNAVLYTYPDTIIKISVSALEEPGTSSLPVGTNGENLRLQRSGLSIIIEDDGPGFPEDELPFIFDKFYRLKNSKAGGTGLGLSIARGFTEALKGHIKIENVAGGGARFIMQIPCSTSYLKVTNE